MTRLPGDRAARYTTDPGIPDWDPGEAYITGDIVRSPDGGFYIATPEAREGVAPADGVTGWVRARMQPDEPR